MADLGFTHVFRRSAEPHAPTLLLLHGTGGDENDLVPLGESLAPGAALLSPRGKVLERGVPRFFRRLAEGVFDLDDLRLRTHELAAFVADAADQYGFDRRRVVAVGFSNGANVAASTLLLEPRVLAGAILFRAMVPIVPDPLPALGGTPVFMSNGRTDSMIPAAQAGRLADLLRQAGADVTAEWQPGGHQLTRQDLSQSQTWFRQRWPYHDGRA
jgi:phospholipase/carboxylesterase/glyoxalase family protein